MAYSRYAWEFWGGEYSGGDGEPEMIESSEVLGGRHLQMMGNPEVMQNPGVLQP